MAMTAVLLQQRNTSGSSGGGQNLQNKEADLENQRRQQVMIDLLTKIESNTAGMLKPDKPDAKGKGIDFGGIGLLASALALALGALVGYIKGYVKLIKGILEAIIPENFKKAFSEKIQKIALAIEEFAGKFKTMLSDSFTKFKNLFVFDEESKIGKVISAIKERMSKILAPVEKALVILQEIFVGFKNGIVQFFKPFKDAYVYIKDTLIVVKDGTSWISEFGGKIKGFFTGIMEWGGNFTKIFKGAMVIFEKLALPLTVIMTLWDTVKGAIAGFEKEGIIGGIKGAITGFFNSLIFGPADMLKDAIAWVLGFFGFDKAQKALESFSFEHMFTDMVNSIASVLTGAFKYISDLWTNFSWEETWGKIIASVSETINSIPGAFVKLKDKIVELWTNFSFDGVLESISKSISEITESIKNWFKDSFKKITNLFSSDDKSAKPAIQPADAKKTTTGDQPKQAKQTTGGDTKGGYVYNEADKKNIQTWVESVKTGRSTMEQVPEVYRPEVSKMVKGSDTKSADLVKSETPTTTSDTKKSSVIKPENSTGSDAKSQSNLIKPDSPTTGGVVYNKSSDNSNSNNNNSKASNTVVSAPSTSNTIVNNKSAKVALPVRNTDSSLRSYLNSRYA